MIYVMRQWLHDSDHGGYEKIFKNISLKYI